MKHGKKNSPPPISGQYSDSAKSGIATPMGRRASDNALVGPSLNSSVTLIQDAL
jgi:hypothetical protein